ncbi:phage baseplate assembly protein V, partial [Myxococcota bacterium]|nr:phage baseplate assembly protein V [Myxococcota bacterium]
RARTLVATLDGDPSVRPGAAIEVQGLTAALDGRYVPVRVSHVIDGARGFVTELSTELGPRTPATPAPVATLAKVVAVDDPAGRGRVRVTAPTLGDVESSWLMVALPAAGGERGLVALPSVGDVVLVLFTSDDLDRAIVVGGVFGAERAPDGVVDRDVRGFVLATRGGQRVTLDDGERRVRVEDATGSFVELSPVKVSLHSAVPLEIEAPGQPLVLRAASIDLKRG